MWFALSILALLMLATRRSAEKRAAGNIDSIAMAWLQQAVAMPLIILSLFFAKFYLPSELPEFFWQLMALYVVLQSLFLYCYFRAISIADISYVAPIMSLFIVTNMIGAYLILGQKPTYSGAIGAGFIVVGAWAVARSKRHKNLASATAHRSALIYILTGIIVMSIYSNIEVKMIRMSNPTSYNFYSSALTIPFVILVSLLILKTTSKKSKEYWRTVGRKAKDHAWALVLVGFTYTINMIATYQAKVLAPNQAYVGAIKTASILPIVMFGVLFLREDVSNKQWAGIASILLGLALIALNV